ncbi:MAG: phosphatidylglycerol lysyltransferase domain-containing protein [Spirochaetia bacterium]
MNISTYPEFAPIDWNMRTDLHPRLSMLTDGISEFTFADLYLFRHKYQYHLSCLPDRHIVISGIEEGKKFFMLPCGVSDMQVIKELFESHDYLKNLSESLVETHRIDLEKEGYTVEEDRDNFDYLYLRKDLAHLPGRKLHKKRNLVNAFVNNYNYCEQRITEENRRDTLRVLEKWLEGREERADYDAAKEALEKMNELDLRGCLTYVDGEPVAYSLGEPLARGKAFAVHFEKAHGNYKGIYQFINRSFASMLPRHFVHINREQDLGDPGLRQAKMSYRPCGFIKKYTVRPSG